MKFPRSITVLGLALAGCNSSLPDVAPESFACESDEVASDGALQCPESHWCADFSCTPRFACVEPSRSIPGCTRDVTRCDYALSEGIAAVSCKQGTFTLTSTLPSDDVCSCPEGLFCATLAGEGTGPVPEAHPLFVLGAGGGVRALPPELGAERPLSRTCVRPCGTELDCPAGHGCRPAVVLENSGIPQDGRRTIGACYPHLLATTSTASEQADPLACRFEGDCTVAAGRFDGLCQAKVVVVPDHPTIPAGEAWGTRYALVPRCVPDNQSNLTPDGRGCANDADCQSGVCEDSRCSRLCDPSEPAVCSFGGDCVERLVDRILPNQEVVLDHVFICGS